MRKEDKLLMKAAEELSRLDNFLDLQLVRKMMLQKQEMREHVYMTVHPDLFSVAKKASRKRKRNK